MNEKIKKYTKEYAPYVIILLLLIMIRAFVVTPVRVEGLSMFPTLNDKDILLLQKYDKTYDRFDIVVFKNQNEKLVKRIIGLPGEHVKYQNNTLYINGDAIEEPFIIERTENFDLTKIGYDTIPEGYYFVVGDNRDDSLDSRYIGLIKKSQIQGTVQYSIFPFSKFGKIEK